MSRTSQLNPHHPHHLAPLSWQMGALLWGHVIGTWVSVINNVNPDLKWFRNTMDSLNVRA